MAEIYTVGVVGDFSGTRVDTGSDSGAASPQLYAVDLDDFDRVMRDIAPHARLDLPFCAGLDFRSRGDFHPDSLLERVPCLAELVAARAAVDDPSAMQAHLRAAAVSLEPAPAPREAATPQPQTVTAPTSDGDLLASMLVDAAEPAGGARPPEASGEGRVLDRAIREIVAESGAAVDFSGADRWRDAIDEALCERLRSILSHPAFRALEVRWTDAFALVRAAAQGEGVRLLLADVPQARFEAEVEAGTDVSDAALVRIAAQAAPAPGERGFDLIVSDYAFEADARGLRQLAWLTAVAEAIATPVLASAVGTAAEPERATEKALEAWQVIAQRPGAHLVGLCAPRVLVRIPYGAAADAIETFAFEEYTEEGGPAAADCLWMGAASLVARAAIRAHGQTGDVRAIGRMTEVEGLPMHVTPGAGAAGVIGPVDQVLTEARVEAFALMGLIPLTGVRGTDTARILSLRSLAGETLIGFA